MTRRRHALAVAFATVAIAAGCGGAGFAPDGPALKPGALARANYCATVTPPPYGFARSGNGANKRPIAGLLDLGQTNFPSSTTPPNTLYFACKAYPAIAGLVVNDNWADLQPGGPNAPIVTTNIDAALSAVAAYNASNPSHPIGVRLRVMGGIDAPQWAKKIGGPVPICDAYHTQPSPSPTPSGATPPPYPTPCPPAFRRTAGAYWTGPYQQAWSNVQHQLAAKYDGNPLVSEVSVTSCTSFGDEEFLSPIDEWTTDRLFGKYKYSNRAFEACLSHALDAYSGWHATIVDDIFNPFYTIAFHSRILTWDLAFTESLMRKCVSSLGPRCMLDNQELGKYTPPPPSPGPTAPPNVQNLFAMWKYMAALHAQGVLVSYQTASPGNLNHTWKGNTAGWNAAVRLAHQYGATSLELWPPEASTLPGPEPCQYSGHPEFTGYTCFSTGALLNWSGIVKSGSSAAP